VLVMTGYGTDYDFGSLSSKGAISFIIKPFNMTGVSEIKSKKRLEAATGVALTFNRA